VPSRANGSGDRQYVDGSRTGDAQGARAFSGGCAGGEHIVDEEHTAVRYRAPVPHDERAANVGPPCRFGQGDLGRRSVGPA
jgi:hypothetical protein